MVVFFDPGEIQIGREPPLAAKDHLAKASPALESKPSQQAALRQELQQISQHDFFLRDHNVAKSGLCGVALDLRAGQHG